VQIALSPATEMSLGDYEPRHSLNNHSQPRPGNSFLFGFEGFLEAIYKRKEINYQKPTTAEANP